MNRKLFLALAGLGGVLLIAGIALPPEKVVRAVLPAARAAFFDKLVAGMWCLKTALVLNGLTLIGLRWLKRWLWDADANLPARPPRGFFAGAPPEVWDRRDVWVMLGLCAVALVLRLIGSQQSLFGDEVGVQQRYISRGLPVILTFYAHGTPPHVLYSLLAFFFERLPLPLELAYRLPAILFGTGAVALTYWLARRVLDRFMAATVGLCSAAALFGIVYSHNAKGYSATHFFALLAIVGLVRVADDWRSPRGWLWFCIAGAGLVWMHLYNVYLWAGLVVMFGGLIVWLTWGDRRMLFAWSRRALFALGLTGLGLALVYALQIPQIYELFVQVTDKPEEHLSLRSVQAWLMQLTFWGEAWPVALACGAVAGIGLLSLARREPRLTVALLFPVAFIWLMIYLKEAWIYPRYLVFTLPVFLLGLVEAGRRLGRGAVAAIALLFLIPNARVLAEYYAAGNQNLRGAVQLAQATARTNDVFVAYGLARDLIPFYDARFRAVATMADLDKLRAETAGRVIVVYGWRKAWRSREGDFQRLDAEYELVGRLPGFLMDSTERDGEMFVLVSREANH
jgi:hypothetical protein